MDKLQESHTPQIQQALHGYDEGHRLIASSVRLPKSADRLMLLLSDLSGSSGGEDFDPYLTGYPVAPGGYYALARTWPAPEMSRPGCVWTHTLLIDHVLLGRVTQPSALLQLFRRPTVADEYADYQKPITLSETFQVPDTENSILGAIDLRLAEGLMQAIYGQTSTSTVLVVPRYSFADAPLLAVWRLQWPSLRHHFTFCGGSRGLRTLEGEPFALQACHERDLRRIDRGTTSLSVLTLRSENLTPAEPWAKEAAQSCIGPPDPDLENFIKDAGRELSGETSLFRPVVQAHIILRTARQREVAHRLIEFVADEFPDKSDGTDLKNVLFRKTNVAGLSEVNLLRGFATAKNVAAFDVNALEMRQRSAALWKRESQHAINLLVELLTSPGNLFAEEVVRGLIQAMPIRVLDRLLRESVEVIAQVLVRRPKLATMATFWNLDQACQSRAAAALAIGSEAVSENTRQIILASLTASADPTDPNLIDAFGPHSVHVLLDWLDADAMHPSQLGTGWRSALALQLNETLDWLHARSSVRPETVEFLLSLIGSDVIVSNRVAMSAFLRHCPREGQASQSVLTSIAGTLLHASIASSLPEAVDLAAVSLDPVYHAAAESRLPDDVWDEIAPLLPDGTWWTWDRCYRIRVGISEKFRTEQWPAGRLTNITLDDAIFVGIVDELKERRSGRRVLVSAAAETNHGFRRDLMSSD